MAVIPCKYHPTTPARWACTNCHIDFCSLCIPNPGQGKLPHCPVCDAELDSLGAGNLILPFWHRLGSFFVYPAYPGPLLLMVLLTSACYVAVNVPVLLAAIILAGLVAVLFMKYAYVVLQDTAHGHLTPRPITLTALTENLILPLKQILLLFVVGGAIVLVHERFGDVVFWVVYLVIMISLPASTMVLALEHRFFQAFNLNLIIKVIGRIGLPYFIMVVLLHLLNFAADMSLNLLHKWVTPQVMVALFFFVSMYFILIMFNLMGYVLYQYHEQLGFSIEVEAQIPDSLATMLPADPELRSVEILIQEGKNVEAAERLAQIIQASPGNQDARERLLKLTRLVNDIERHTKQGQDYISYLLHESKLSQAVKIYQECSAFDSQFRPARPAERVELARQLRSKGQTRAALTLLGNLHRDFPTYDGIPQAYLTVAQLLCEQHGEDEKAIQILQYVLKNYPHHSLTHEIQNYLKVVEGLLATRK